MNTGCVTNECDLNLNLNSNYCNNVHCRGIGCGHTIELNRDLAFKSRLTSNHDLA